ncbi:hypothetical protein GCM10027431_26560 [Lysobacter rhizosphaerae]
MIVEATHDVITRNVRFALELLDPFDGRTVCKGLRVEAKDDEGRPTGKAPIVSRSGRFIWLSHGDPLPASVGLSSGRLPYASYDIPIPADLKEGGLIRVRLRLRRDYSIPKGVTAMRGTLFRKVRQEGQEERRLAIPGAVVQMVWRSIGGWIVPEPALPSQIGVGESITDDAGEFIVFARLRRDGTGQSDYVGHSLADRSGSGVRLSVDTEFPDVRLRVTRFDPAATAWTAKKFSFLKTIEGGCIPLGELLPTRLQLDWNELKPQ